MTFSRPAALAFAQDALSAPPAARYVVRPKPAGELVWQCVVPAELCPTVNVGLRANHWKRAKNKRQLFAMMLAQNGLRVRWQALPGRPVVHCIRFTSVCPDAQTAWSKDVVDCLLTRKVTRLKNGNFRERQGLGFIEDDSPEHIDLHCWWEPGKPKAGFVLVRVYGGEE